VRILKNWRTALRIAWRETRLAKGRSALVVALIGLPVMALVFAVVSYDTFTLRPAERLERQLGAADALMTWEYGGPVRQPLTELFGGPVGDPAPRTTTAAELEAALPAGSRVLLTRNGTQTFRTAHGQGSVPTRELAYTDPVARGILRQLEGRAPANTDEVALTAPARERLGVGIGGTVSLADGSRTWRVVGVVEDPSSVRGQLMIFMPGTFPLPALHDRGGLSGVHWLVDTPAPLDWAGVRALNAKGITALSREVVLHPPANPEGALAFQTDGSANFSIATTLAGLLVLEVVLLAGPAFAVGARRRRRDLALVAAAGGTPRQLRRIVLADGVLLGAVSAGAGLALGVLIAWLSTDLVARYLYGNRPGAFRTYPSAIAAIALLAVTAGVLAALLPAWMAGRVPVTAALSGRYTPSRVRHRWVVVGALMMGAGTAIVFLGTRRVDAGSATLGLMIGQLGLVLCTPALVALVARLGGRLVLPVRIALRDAGRNRAATASAISAVLGAVAVSAMLATLTGSSDAAFQNETGPGLLPTGYGSAQVDPNHNDGQGRPVLPPAAALPLIANALRDSLPVADVVPVSAVDCGPNATTFCSLDPELPAERKCPYWERVGTLSAADKKAARRDERCNDNDALMIGPRSSQRMSLVLEPDALGRVLRLDRATLDRAQEVLRAGGVLVRNPRVIVDGRATVTIYGLPGEEPAEQGHPAGKRVTLPAMALPAHTPGPRLTITPAAVTALGLWTRPDGFVARTTRMPTEAERDRMLAEAAKVPGAWKMDIERQPRPEREDPWLVLFAIAAGVVTLGAAAIATGLAAAESRGDLATLGAVGASPTVRRLLSISRMGLIAGLGSVLGTVAGVAGAATVIIGRNRAADADWPPLDMRMPLVVPWQNVVISLLVVPVVAMLLAGMFTRARLPIERRQ
jgi:putative ABC transport system permease protein